ncbi:MAG TPA: preprotein translocase subunit SecG [Candidatus Sulfotelmatobacter sp.]|nr:preprotein translocase subunit SecG [Candidatus Sulfotelmatobacter sp.]
MRVQVPPSAPSLAPEIRANLFSNLFAVEVREKLNIMIYLVTTIHILVCFFIIVVVLLQSGKSGDISAAFGGQGSQTAFGPRGAASALSKATTWSAVAFMVTSITLAVYASKRSGAPTSVLQGIKSQPVKTQPAPANAPANPPAQPKK